MCGFNFKLVLFKDGGVGKSRTPFLPGHSKSSTKCVMIAFKRGLKIKCSEPAEQRIKGQHQDGKESRNTLPPGKNVPSSMILPPALLVEYTCSAPQKAIQRVFKKLRIELPLELGISLLSIYTKYKNTKSKRYVHPFVHCNIIHSDQDIDTTQIFTDG